MSEKTSRTGETSEFYVMYLLHRAGADAFLTFGNKKKMDIVVKKGAVALTVDVKGLKSSGNFIIDSNDNYKEYLNDSNHYYILVYFKEFENVDVAPEFFILPATKLGDVIKHYADGRNEISVKDAREHGSQDLSVFVDSESWKF